MLNCPERSTHQPLSLTITFQGWGEVSDERHLVQGVSPTAVQTNVFLEHYVARQVSWDTEVTSRECSEFRQDNDHMVAPCTATRDPSLNE